MPYADRDIDINVAVLRSIAHYRRYTLLVIKIVTRGKLQSGVNSDSKSLPLKNKYLSKLSLLLFHSKRLISSYSVNAHQEVEQCFLY